MKTWTIYGLCGPDGILRYVGVTRLPLADRLRNHITESVVGGTNRKCNWIRGLDLFNERPTICELETLADADEADAAEAKWIDMARRFGCDLLNKMPGGAGGAKAGRPVSTGRGKGGRVTVRLSKDEADSADRLPRAAGVTVAEWLPVRGLTVGAWEGGR